MKTLYALSLVYMCVYMYICGVIDLFGTCIYVGYICMFIFSCRGMNHSASVLLYGLMWQVFILVMAAPIRRVNVSFFHV